MLNTLKFSYSTSSETPSALLTDTIYQILNKHDEDPHDASFESWKAVFAADGVVQARREVVFRRERLPRETVDAGIAVHGSVRRSKQRQIFWWIG